jgi:hypothetical protein
MIAGRFQLLQWLQTVAPMGLFDILFFSPWQLASTNSALNSTAYMA